MLGWAILANLAFKMTVLFEEPKIHKEWLRKTGQFYDAALHMKKLQGGTTYIPTTSGPQKTQWDLNTIDVNWLYLTPVQHTEHIHNNKCFICHRVGCSTCNHPGGKGNSPQWKTMYLPRNQCPHNICSTNTPPLPPTQLIDEVANYLNVMHSNSNLSNANLLQSLQSCLIIW